MSERVDQPWSLDLPGLDSAGAAEIVSFARDTGLCELASAVDPNLFLTLHLDRATVEVLSRMIKELGKLPDSGAEMTLQGISEDFEEWLATIDR